MKKKIFKISLAALLISTYSSCVKDSVNDVDLPGNYENGYFVTNEGNFGSGNGSVSYVSNNGSVDNEVFASVNSFPLGDVVQSMEIIGDNVYIVVNGSSKIEVASEDSLISIATINGLTSPRYMSAVSENKAYVTDWGVNGVQVIDLLDNSITSTITCGNGPEGIVVSNGFAYVCNVGGWGLDNTVSVINVETDVVETTLTVGDKPESAVVDADGAVWVLSGGYTEWNSDWSQILSQTPGSLIKIVNNNIETTYTFDVGSNPGNLVINEDGTDLYFSNGSIYTMNISDSQLPNNPLINRGFYGLGFNNGYLFGADAVDFSQYGWSFKYSSQGILIDSVNVGVIPGGYCFN
jgi:YVTN family beta-propeller protein